MKRLHLQQLGLAITSVMSVVSLSLLPASAMQAASSTAARSAADSAKLKLIISRGTNEIDRRLTTLNKLSSKINSASKLSSADKSALTGEVSDEINNLTSLKAKLSSDTDVTTARSDAQSVITDYRVYALIVPKVNLVKTADDQQVAEAKLSALSTKLQTRIDSAKSSGKSVTSAQNSLNDLNAKASAAQTISSNIESSVISLQPSDYNSNHSVLSGDRDQLVTARGDIQTAITDAQSVITALKNL